MSASPSGPPSNGRTPTPNGGQPQFIRRPRPADPLRQNQRKPQRQPAVSKSSASKPNGLKPTNKQAQPYRGAAPLRTTGSGPLPANGVNHPKPTSGFTQTPEGPFQDFPLYATKKALREGLRYHIARFASKKGIDPSNQVEFTRPVSLHRRDPRQPPPGKAIKDEDPSTGLPLDDKEQEKLEIARLEKEAQKAADLAQIAPTGNNATALAAKKNAAFRNEKTTQIHRLDKTEEEKKESDLRYEEALPWHLEDAENKHTWVGNYEAALSDINVILIIEGTSFKMIPIEKWYKFTPKNQFKTLTIEEAEAQMKQKSKASRWVMHTQQMLQQDAEMQATRRQLGNMYKVKGESSTFKKSAKSETREADDLDFDDVDLFDDDDEQPTAEPEKDEETKYAAEKIKREQLGANLFGEADEAEVEKELEEEEKQAEVKKKLGKKMKKALQKREKNYLYDSDSSHPYSTSVYADQHRKKG
jgi:transcription initiation factor TFIIF subunit alpha